MTPHRPIRCLFAVAALALAAGCATEQNRADAYDRQLARWHGATEESLVAAWGRPLATETVEGGRVLVYVNNQVGPVDNRPTVSFGIGGWGGGGNTAVGGGVGVTRPVGSNDANSCVTRFLVHDGRIESWTFEGGGCGLSAM
jgi:hypothetical protein